MTKTETKTPPPCSHRVWHGYGSSPCTKPGKLKRGKHFFCAMHDPEKEAYKKGAETFYVASAESHTKYASEDDEDGIEVLTIEVHEVQAKPRVGGWLIVSGRLGVFRYRSTVSRDQLKARTKQEAVAELLKQSADDVEAARVEADEQTLRHAALIEKAKELLP